MEDCMSLPTGSAKATPEQISTPSFGKPESSEEERFVSSPDQIISATMTLSDFELLRLKFPSVLVVVGRSSSGEKKYALFLEGVSAAKSHCASVLRRDGLSMLLLEDTARR